MDRFERRYPCRLKARCGWTVETERGRRKLRWWVRVTRDGAVVSFKDGLKGPDEAKALADVICHEEGTKGA